jgi:hypothetical protein
VFKSLYLVFFLLHWDNLPNFEGGVNPEYRGECWWVCLS